MTLFPQTPADAWRELAAEYTPTFWDDDRLADRTADLGDRGRRAHRAGGHRCRATTATGPPCRRSTTCDTDFLGALRARASSRKPSTSSSTPTSTPITSAGTPSVDGDSWVPTFPNARYLMPEADYRYFHPDNADTGRRHAARTEAARQATWRIVFGGQRFSGRGPDRAVVRRPSDQRGASAAAGAGPHAGVLGAVAGRGQARGVRRRPDPLPDPAAPADGSVRVRRGLRGRGGDAQAGADRGLPAPRCGRSPRTIRATAARPWSPAGDAFMVDDWLELPPI